MRPLFEAIPSLQVPWVELATLPTPIEPLLAAGPDVWVKQDGRSSPLYGGNKVRTLEPLCALALDRGADRIYGTGAFGSNHVLATVVHAPRAGLKAGAVLFPQPHSPSAIENARVLMSRCDEVVALPHWACLPWGMWRAKRRARARGESPAVMVPGGAIPAGTLGYVSAAFEVALQIEAGSMPAPKCIVLPVGSTCTSAGLLAGFALAEALVGLPMPHLRAVRVTPWPVTAPWRIARLAQQTLRYLERNSGRRFEMGARLRPHLSVDGAQLGRGYGHATPAGHAAIAALGDAIKLDTTYSAKAAAALAQAPRPTLFWATKSEVLPEPGELAGPARVQKWMG